MGVFVEVHCPPFARISEIRLDTKNTSCADTEVQMGDCLTVVEEYVGFEEDQNTTKERRFGGAFVAAPKEGKENQGKIQMSKNQTPDKRMLCLQAL